ncbi:MAG: TraR/DksA C4-type zinc finger protein [Burkholderiales bacterium]|nr:TraR/DksA C4-type zinc finger protein [Burkholderiales bacterium]
MDDVTQPGGRRLAGLMRAIEARERALRDRIAERRDALEDVNRPIEPAGDDADQAFERDRLTVENDVLELHLAELAELAAARARAAEGVYGLCVDCNEPIAQARLAANPVARRCTDCQARHERLYNGRS